MKVTIKKVGCRIGCQIVFVFNLDNDDKRISISTNAGKQEIALTDTTATFDIPFDICLPHPDLLALAALKIISPYIGSHFEINFPISDYFAHVIKYCYPNIKTVKSAPVQSRIAPLPEKYAVSFSGGADSLAAANLCPPGTPLILLARKYHSKLGKFESWYRTDGNIETLMHMGDDFVKIPVLSDFEFLSVNKTKTYCVYPDNYAFTIPCILLADHLNLSGILTGDMIAAFSGDERAKFSTERFKKQQLLYLSVGLNIDSAVKGVTELGTEIINRYYKNSNNANTCQYGGFQKPCMHCVKCFRKSLIKAYLDGVTLDEKELKEFNKSAAIINLSKKDSIPVPLTLKLITNSYNWQNYPILNVIKQKLQPYPIKSQLLQITMDPYENEILSPTIQYCLNNIKRIFKERGEFHLKDIGL